MTHDAPVDPERYWEERARTRGAIAADYQDPVLRAFEAPLRRRVFFDRVPWRPGLRVLDAGTGTGDWAMEFWRRGAAVVGIDISAGMIQLARDAAARSGAEIRYEVGRIQELPPEYSGRFDLVTSITVLQHLLDDGELDRALACCARALAPGGRLACMENTMGGRRRGGNSYMRFRSRKEWLHRFERAGFVAESMAAVWCVPLVLLLYRAYARLRWARGYPTAPTWDGRAWCGALNALNGALLRTPAAAATADLTLFVLGRVEPPGGA